MSLQVVPVGPSPQPDVLSIVAEVAVQSLSSRHTRRAYAREIKAFLSSGQSLDRYGVQKWINEKRESGLSSSSLIVSMAAIRTLAKEANMRGLLDDQTTASIDLIVVKPTGPKRTGNWLTIEECQRLIDATGQMQDSQRNACVIALLVGSGLRRFELVSLQWEQIQMRNNRPVIVDLTRKRNKQGCVVPIPMWAYEFVERWRVFSGASSGPVFDFACVDNAYYIVRTAGQLAGLTVSPHDLRRTCAELMTEAGADVRQVQKTLGHQSIATTQNYLDSKPVLALGKAGVDHIPALIAG